MCYHHYAVSAVHICCFCFIDYIKADSSHKMLGYTMGCLLSNGRVAKLEFEIYSILLYYLFINVFHCKLICSGLLDCWSIKQGLPYTATR